VVGGAVKVAPRRVKENPKEEEAQEGSEQGAV
jgi:hypothetical protein